MTEQEKRGADAVAYFQEVLDERFLFIRADLSTVDKDGFLAALSDPGNVSEVLTTQIREARVMVGQAFVEALVRLEGTRGGKRVEGTFKCRSEPTRRAALACGATSSPGLT
jgi:hypothetical protein